MSAIPTSLLCRTGTLAAAAALTLALPTAALGKDKDKHKDHGKPAGDTPAACADAKQSKHPHGGAPGLTKKADDMPECRDVDEQAPTDQGPPLPPMVVNVNNVTVAAPEAAAPVSAAASSSSGKCEKRRVFRMTLHKGRAKTASVKLNGRAIRATKGKRKTSVRINTRGQKNKNFTVRFSVVTKKGRLKTGTRRFRTCG